MTKIEGVAGVTIDIGESIGVGGECDLLFRVVRGAGVDVLSLFRRMTMIPFEIFLAFYNKLIPL